ncbi:MAG: hypothetical protein ACR2L2_18920 [Acidobacteriota bacterium]
MPRSKFSNLLLSSAAGLLLLSLVWLAVSAATAVGFLIVDRGGVSWATQGGSGTVLVGYGRIQPDAGSTTPAGLAIFGLRQNGILVTETGVPASALTLSGRIYAERSNSVNTGVAMANPNNQGALVNFFFTDINGNNFGAGSFTIPANGQRSAFLNEAPFNGGTILNGTFTYSSSVPISAVAIRGLNNERGEFLITTLPVVPLGVVVGETVLIPHFADGGGWTTQIILVNPTDESISGTIQFLGQGSATSSAQPVVVSIGGQSNSTFSYTIPPRSSRSLPTLGQDTTTRAGSVRITPLANQRTPAGLSVFSFRQAGIVVTEGGVPTLRPTTAFRMYAESAQVGAIQTGVAVANNSPTPVAVNFELTTLAGGSTGLTGTETIGGNGQTAKFLNQIQGFGSLASPFQGILRISTASAAGVAVIGLRGRTNERGDFLITTTPPADETAAASNAELDFPQFVDNGGYTTQFILFSSTASPTAAGIFGRFRATAPLNGTLRFFNQAGQPADLNLGTAPDLAISKSHTGSFTQGANGVYTIQILNVGVGATSGTTTVTDTLPAGLSFVSATGTGWNCSAAGAAVTCVNTGPIAPAASSTITLTVAVSAAASGTLTNTVTVSNSSDSNPANNTSSDQTGIGSGVDMSITKSDSPDPAFVGADLTYTLTIRNNGPATATGVVVTDPLPAGVTFVSATPVLPATCSFSNGTVTCSFGSISNGDSKQVQIVVRPTAAGTLTNTATVTRNENDPVASNNSSTATTTVNAANADLSVSQTGPPTCSITSNNCDGVTYSVTVTNNGPGPASAVVLTDTLPIDPPSGATVVTLVSVTPSQGTCSGVSGGAFSCNLGTLNSGASTTVAVVVNVDATAIGRTITNAVSVSSGTTDPNTANNTSNFSHAVTPTQPETDLEVTTLTDSPDPVTVGSNLTYTATVINKGRSTATQVIVTDTLPAGVTFVSATSTQGGCSFSGGTVTCTLGTLLRNVSRTITIVVTPTTVGAKSNTVSISGNSGENDPVAGNNSRTVSTTVNGVPDLSIIKSDGGLAFTVSVNGSYTITVTNGGTAATTGTITVNDTLPAGLSFVSGTGTNWLCSALGQAVTCIRSVAIATSANSTITLTVNPTSPGSVTNTATVSTAGEVYTADNSGSDTTTINNADANLSVAKSGPLSCNVSGTACTDVTYTIVISNSGPQAASGVVLTDTLPLDPAGSGATIATLKSATSPSGTCGTVSGGAFTCNLGTIANGGSATVTVVVDIDATAQGRIATNNSSVAATSSDPNTSNNADPHPVSVFPGNIDSDMGVTMTGPTNVALNADATYVATINNNGLSGATGVTLTDVLPSNTAFVSATSTKGTCSLSGGTITCSIGAMARTAPLPAPGSAVTVTIVVRYTTTGARTHTVSVTRVENDPNAANNTASRGTTVF